MPLSTEVSLLQAEPTLVAYFQSFNQGDFATTAALFSPQGELHAPFEEPIVGAEAIQAYLEQEAAAMKATPTVIGSLDLPGESRRIIVQGNVRALIFNVNVRWTFLLDGEERIEQVQVKLLASLQELITLRPEQSASG